MNYKNYVDPFIDEVPKHKKRKGKTAPKKSSHKHIYKSYIGLVVKGSSWRKNRYFPVTVCNVCGKVGKVGLHFTERTERGYFSVIDDVDRIKVLNPELEVKEFEKFPW